MTRFPDTAIQIDLDTDEYAIRFAFRGDKRRSDNLPIAITRQSWEAYQAAAKLDPETEAVVVTTTGERLHLRRADCGAGCRCALSWRPADA